MNHRRIYNDNDAKRDAVRALIALSTAINLIDAGRLRDVDIDHIKANVDHLAKLTEEARLS